MSTPRTKIKWQLHNYCQAECSYCPISLRGGEEPRHINDYIAIADKLNKHYGSLGRITDWVFNGGELLDTDYFPGFLKTCKEGNGSIEITTSGGRLWMDWWAIEPYVDVLHLSYHYWQNPSLIEYIVDLFLKKGKEIDISVPMRPDFFDDDLARALEIEKKFGLVVGKSVLYKNAHTELGMFPYTDLQLKIMSGEVSLIEERDHHEETTPEQRIEEKFYQNENKFTGQLCNVGIEMLVIGYNGYATGANCNNDSLGNIWENDWMPPTQPQRCTMIACIHQEDQQITKFP